MEESTLGTDYVDLFFYKGQKIFPIILLFAC